MKHISIVAAAIMLAGCQTTIRGQEFDHNPMSNLDKTLTYGQTWASTKLQKNYDFVQKQGGYHIATMGNQLAAIGDRLEKDKKLPVVVLMHGCGGYYDKMMGLFTNLAQSGMELIVFSPNSFGRVRPKACTGLNGWNSFLEKSYEFREAELDYAMTELLKHNFVDRNNIFLLGHSQGASSVADYDPSDHGIKIKGRIYSAGACGAWDRFGVGGNISSDEKSFLLVSKNDPWDFIRNGGCGHFAKTRHYVDEPSHTVLATAKYGKVLNAWLREAINR